MRPIVTDEVEWSVSRSVCHDREPCKTAEPIEMSFGMWTWVGPSKYVLKWSAHWHHLANTIEPSMCGGDTVLCHIALTTCYGRMAVLWNRAGRYIFVFSFIFTAALRSRCVHYIFALCFLLLSSFFLS